MTRYFFHLIDGMDVLLDPEGVEVVPETIPALALVAARDCMAADIRAGWLDLTHSIDVQSDDGRVVHHLDFADALEFVAHAGTFEQLGSLGRSSAGASRLGSGAKGDNRSD